MYGSVREKIVNASTAAGAIGGGVLGVVAGGIWSFIGRGAEQNHWGRKTLGSALVLSAIGAVVSRITWGKDMAEKNVSLMQQQIEQLPAEQQAMAYQTIAQQLGKPQPSVQASSIDHQAPQLGTATPQR